MCRNQGYAPVEPRRFETAVLGEKRFFTEETDSLVLPELQRIQTTRHDANRLPLSEMQQTHLHLQTLER